MAAAQQTTYPVYQVAGSSGQMTYTRQRPASARLAATQETAKRTYPQGKVSAWTGNYAPLEANPGLRPYSAHGSRPASATSRLQPASQPEYRYTPVDLRPQPPIRTSNLYRFPAGKVTERSASAWEVMNASNVIRDWDSQPRHSFAQSVYPVSGGPAIVRAPYPPGYGGVIHGRMFVPPGLTWGKTLERVG